jgi:hypothetical protein
MSFIALWLHDLLLLGLCKPHISVLLSTVGVARQVSRAAKFCAKPGVLEHDLEAETPCLCQTLVGLSRIVIALIILIEQARPLLDTTCLSDKRCYT